MAKYYLCQMVVVEEARMGNAAGSYVRNFEMTSPERPDAIVLSIPGMMNNIPRSQQ